MGNIRSCMNDDTGTSTLEQQHVEECIGMNDTVTSTVEQDVEEYAACIGMDAANTKAMKIFKTQGTAAGLKHIMTNPHTGKPMSYAESRGMYG